VATKFRVLIPKQPKPEQRDLTSKLSQFIGSWKFIGGQAVILFFWITINAFAPVMKWDKPPYILLNLMLSFQAAFTGPVLLMAANKQAEIDRERDIDHYMIDMHDSHLIEEMAMQLDYIHKHKEDPFDEEHY